MQQSTRRAFLAGAGATALTALAPRRIFAASAARSIQVRTDLEIGVIRPELHGQFAEHLGSCIYGGLWVGRGSSIPNIDGYRKQAIEYLKPLHVPVLRWPGGCFADDYHWRDGIGPPAQRPKSVNIHWGMYTEDNSFGTQEFIGLCRLLGAQPYLAGNVGSGRPEELRDWMEYCNYPSGSTLSGERAKNGSPQPFAVKYWGVGNENWGCGGNMTASEYAALYRRFTTYMPAFGGAVPFLVACGPSGNNPEWSREFFTALGSKRKPSGFTMHFYSNGKDYATHYDAAAMDAQLASFATLEAAIHQQRGLLDGFDPERRVGMLIDEWGVWDRMDPEEEKRYGRLWQQITMRSAVAAGLGLNIFQRQADKLVMCNIAQIVNVLQSMLLTYGDKCIRTSTYWVFDMMKEHQGQTSLQVENADTDPLGLSVSASRGDKTLLVTLVNPKNDAALSVRCELAAANAASATARVLHDSDLNACNTFDQPVRLTPRPLNVAVNGGVVTLDLPALSVATVAVQLA